MLKKTFGLESETQEAAEIVERQLSILVRLVDDLLDISRISQGKIELQPKPVDLGGMAQQAADSVTTPDCEGKHKVKVNAPAEPVEVNGDPNRLAQVFGNLLNNACKFTPPDGQIEVTVRREGKEAVVSIKDSGIGIPPEQIDTIFDMFSQVHQGGEPKQAGLGIGLSLVKRLVEL